MGKENSFAQDFTTLLPNPSFYCRADTRVRLGGNAALIRGISCARSARPGTARPQGLRHRVQAVLSLPLTPNFRMRCSDLISFNSWYEFA